MTAARPIPRPLYLDAVPDAVFGMFHAPLDHAPSKTAVLICPPWGWDEVGSYRSRRTWAEHLAENGHPTLRVDLPATGDSAGDPDDPARLAAWTAAIVAATTWLAGTTSSRRVAVVGLGLGGLLAGQALAAGAQIDDLVLWAAPASGRSFLREQRAFGMLQSSRYGPDADSAVPPADGSLEIGGFVLSLETIAAIGLLDLREMDLARVQRAFLLEREGTPVDAGVRGHLEQSGVDVSVAPGPGWEDMCFHPERYQPPLEVFERVTAWLGTAAAPRADATKVASDLPAPVAADHAYLVVDGAQLRETTLSPHVSHGEFFGVLAEPGEPARTGVCAVFLNAGAVRRIGPNRMWVDVARRWAANGIPTVRVDVEGIGDADGDAAMYFDVGRFYTPDREAQVTAILDALESRGIGKRFILIGLCAGAYSAFNTAALDTRVVAALAINPRVLVWHPTILVRRSAYLVNKVLEVGSWQRILNGETTPARVFAIGRAAVAEAPRAVLRYASRLRGERQLYPWSGHLEERLEQLRDSGTRVVLAFAGDEPVYDELEQDGVLARLDRWPNVVVLRLPGEDHTLRPIAAQRALHRLFDAELDQLLKVADPKPSPGLASS